MGTAGFTERRRVTAIPLNFQWHQSEFRPLYCTRFTLLNGRRALLGHDLAANPAARLEQATVRFAWFRSCSPYI